MRLDLCLKYSGLVKRRSVCKLYCEHGLVQINNKIGKPSSEVKDGDIIRLSLGNRIITFKVSLLVEGRTIKVTYDLISQEKKVESDA